HPNTNVRESFFHICRGRSGRGCNDRHERCADRVTKVHFEEECQQRHQYHAAAKAGERSEKSSDERADPHQKSEFDDVHANLVVCHRRGPRSCLVRLLSVTSPRLPITTVYLYDSRKTCFKGRGVATQLWMWSRLIRTKLRQRRNSGRHWLEARMPFG